MVARTYYGLGSLEAAIGRFEALTPWVVQMLEMQGECLPMGSDYLAMGIALDGLQTTAFHFTRRRHFYHQLDALRPAYRPGNDRLGDRQAAIAAFEALTPYSDALGRMKDGCRPFGRDYMAIRIAQQSLGTAAFHFTREEHFYGARSDSAGPIRPPR
jgi:hypothetical protein